ncbi:hypothetical protein M0R45_026269 [Rubus argutus]|uniref:Zinc finger MYM-type protein 1-like n=1 Tax=Rubus argutus TaxID=59490 RepID=A0AAW1WYU0_RUBAR
MAIEDDRVVLENAPGNAKYTSPGIQKQLLNILGNKVRNMIREEIGDAKFFILVDEAVDVASKEQMSIILRFVDCYGMVRERFFKIVSVPNTTSQTLKIEISKVLSTFNLQVKNIRGQGYDGASNMSGIWNGLQALFLEECPYAYYGLSELNKRFTDQSSELLILSSTLDPCVHFSQFKTEKVCTLAKKFYPEDFVHDELFSLELECAYYERDMLKDPKFQNLTSVSGLCQQLVQIIKSEFFPMIYRLICLVLTLHVSTTTPERAFSSMNIIKNKIRNRIEDEFLDDCMVLHIENEFAEVIDNDSVIKEFEALRPRTVSFS